MMGLEMVMCDNDYKALECGSTNYFQSNEDFLLTSHILFYKVKASLDTD